MATNEHIIKAPGMLKNLAVGGHLTTADQILDDAIGKEQSQINAETATAITNEVSRAEAAEELLRQAYEALTQSAIVVGDLPASGEVATIYRVPGESSYKDYMWDGTQFVEMAEYDNAIDDDPTAGSNNLVKSGGVRENIDVVVNKTDGYFVDNAGIIRETTNSSYSLSDLFVAFPGVKIKNPIAAGEGYEYAKVCFYDKNFCFVSFIGENNNGDIVLSSENIPEDALYFRANLNSLSGKISSNSPNLVGIISDVNTKVNKSCSDLFCIPGFITRKTGVVALNFDYISTGYINVTYVSDNAIVCALFSSENGIQAFDENKNFIGIYNDFSSITGPKNIMFNFDKTKLPLGTKYIKMSAKKGEGFIIGYNSAALSIPNHDYITSINENYEIYAKAFKFIKINDNYYNYDFNCIIRIPAYNEFKAQTTGFVFGLCDYDAEAESGFAITRRIVCSCKSGRVNNNTIHYNDGIVEFIYDYDISGQINTLNNASTPTNLLLSQSAFEKTTYMFTGDEYVHTDTSSLATKAASFTSITFKSDRVLDITVQRFPATNDILADNSKEFVCFYVWNDDGSLNRKIYIYVRDCSVDNNVVTYESDDFSFVLDYNVCGTVGRTASITRLDMQFTDIAFDLVYSGDYHIRKDIVGKNYTNLSSSTFSSFSWHKNLIADLGMNYNNVGMGGSCHRPYNNTAKFNLNYQDPNEPVADRNVLNMVANLCTQAITDDYYPDIIVSCCVLNDCYKSAIPIGTDPITKIGTAEDAINAILPQLDLSTAESIEETFSAFFNSTNSEIVAFRNNSMKMMRLSVELLSQRFPYAQIIICSCQQIGSDTINQQAVDLFNQEQRKLAKYYAIPYIDISGESGINVVTIPTFLASDLLHPNSAGQIIYTKYMKEKLNTTITLKR